MIYCLFSAGTDNSFRAIKSHSLPAIPNRSTSADVFNAVEKALIDSEESPERPRSTS